MSSSGIPWEALESVLPTGEALRARYLVPSVTERVLAALDREGRRHLLIPIGDIAPGVQDSLSKGLTVLTRALLVDGKVLGRYIDLRCNQREGYRAFDIIGQELASSLEHTNASAEQCTVDTLARWRRFFAHGAGDSLSRQEQVGLFAELWFLTRWLAPALGSQALGAWRGPFRARHDFEWSAASVEVKATEQVHGTVHRIHGIDQLEKPLDRRLFLFSAKVREEHGGVTLPQLVREMRALCEARPTEQARLDAALEELGYQWQVDGVYEGMKIRVAEEGLYEVRSGFPHLARESFASGVPAGVTYVEYDLDMAACRPFLVARTSEEFGSEPLF